MSRRNVEEISKNLRKTNRVSQNQEEQKAEEKT